MRYDIRRGVKKQQIKLKTLIIGVVASAGMVGGVAVPAIAATPGAVVKNPNANANACWGMDRSYYASTHFFPENQSLNQSFPGDLGEQLAAWVATYCDPHGPTL